MNKKNILSQEIAREDERYQLILKRVKTLLKNLEKDSERLGRIRTSHAQNRIESEALLNHKQSRLDKLWFAQDKLLFGKLEMLSGECYYIGKVGVSDERQDNILIDWRAPIAKNYYQASHINNMGVGKKRTIKVSPKKVTGLHDEVYNQNEILTPTVETLDSELLNELNKKRTGKMGEVVSTLQSEQDRIMRISDQGPLIIDGPPGTGKTVVALHRAAFLLYNNRDKIKNKGVLVIGPNKKFLEYIDNVLPSLGEDEVNLSETTSLIEIPNQLVATRDYKKSNREMARTLNEITQNLPLGPKSKITINLVGESVTFTQSEILDLINQAKHQKDRYNEIREIFLSLLLNLGVEKLIIARELEEVDDYEKLEIASELRESAEFRREANLLFMPFTPERLLYKLSSDLTFFKRLVSTSVKERWELLSSYKDNYLNLIYDKDDLFILDYLHDFLGDVKVSYIDDPDFDWNESQIIFNDKIYAHIIIDEAQELSYLEWSSLSNRLGLKSMTIVGDWAQQNSATGLTSWQEVLSIFGKNLGKVEYLNINYRTPKEIMDYALKVMKDKYGKREIISLRSIPGSLSYFEPSQEKGLEVFLQTLKPDTLIIGEGYTSPIDCKGLEFDEVVIINPREITKKYGVEAYFVALTRATQKLTIIEG